MNVVTDGIVYFHAYDFITERRLYGFEKVGEAKYIQGKGYKFAFLENKVIGEFAIKVQHKYGPQVYIFKDKDAAESFCKRGRCHGRYIIE